eukprot:9228098-Pyramimonas_sp.AAC.1
MEHALLKLADHAKVPWNRARHPSVQPLRNFELRGVRCTCYGNLTLKSIGSLPLYLFDPLEDEFARRYGESASLKANRPPS